MKIGVFLFLIVLNWTVNISEQAKCVSEKSSVILPPLQMRYTGLSCPVKIDGQQNETKVKVFLGIPFAEKPIGKLRFNRTVPYKGRKSMAIDATRYKPACPQHGSKTSRFVQEDCLYLNIFTPEINPTKKLPVIVHIHGGSYHRGSSHLTPGQVLASQGVVVVTFNYRLGVFGFLPFGVEHANGNLGLWDQLEALQWVQDYISFFGGDNKSVTLMGESAGAASVHFLSVSPQLQNKNLFHQVFAVSGSMLSPWSHLNEQTQLEIQNSVKSYLNCSACNATVLLDRMQKENVDKIQTNILGSQKHLIQWGPIVDNHFIVKSPLYTLRNCHSSQPVPYLTSMTANETAWSLSTGKRWQRIRDANESSVANELLQLFSTLKNDRYNLPPLSSSVEYQKFNDFAFISPMYKFTMFAPSRCFHPRLQVKVSLQLDDFKLDTHGSGHGDDRIFHFGIPFVDNLWWQHVFQGEDKLQQLIRDDLNQISTTLKAKENSLKLMKMIINFAYNGTLEGVDKLGDTEYFHFTEEGEKIEREERLHQVTSWFDEDSLQL